jgi:hypothetical protein
MVRSLPLLMLGLVVGFCLGSCVQIDGGAVEVSWVIHANGRAITDCGCSFPEIASVRLDLVGHGGAIEGTTPCAGRARCEFACQRQTGATPFDIPETHGDEMYGIRLVAVGLDGNDLPTVTTPAPILRTVVRGQPTEVEALVLEAGCALTCEGMNNSGVCARP